MDEITSKVVRKITFGQAFCSFIMCLSLLVLSIITIIGIAGIDGLINPFVISIIALAYIGIGIFLNLKVLRNLVDFHPVYNTLGNVVQAKLGALLGWPIVYPYLFILLFVNKYL